MRHATIPTWATGTRQNDWPVYKSDLISADYSQAARDASFPTITVNAQVLSLHGLAILAPASSFCQHKLLPCKLAEHLWQFDVHLHQLSPQRQSGHLPSSLHCEAAHQEVTPASLGLIGNVAQRAR